ncbi:MAG: endonuclease, partial [Ferruginibacter sp.]
MQLKISSNYVSGTDPNTATWTNLNGNFPANVAVTGTWTLSNNIELLAFNTANVRVAWIYINPTTTASSRWTIDDVIITSNIPCPEPAAQPTNLTLNATVSTVSGTFTAVVAPTTIQNYLVVRSLNSTLTQLPVDGTSYTIGQIVGGGNGTVINVSNNGIFSDNSVAFSTQYFYFVFSMEDQGCVGGPNYRTINPLTLGVLTATPPPCVTPAAPTSSFTLTSTNNSITGSLTGSRGSKYLVIRSTVMPPLGASPANGTRYTAGQTIGNGTVVSYVASTTFTATGLSVSTTYYFYVFSANDVCVGEPFYSTASLNGSATTTNNPTGIPAGYYDAANGLTCAPLKTALSNIITNGHTQNSYGSLDDIEMLVTDDRLNDAGTATIVYDMYSDNPTGTDPYTYTFSQFNIGTGSDGEGNGWNKEHSFPN